MNRKKLFYILIPIILLILIVFMVLFIKYKNLSILVDVVAPGNATITEDPLKGKSVVLYEGGYTTLDINIKDFFNVNVYPIIEDEKIIEYDKTSNRIIAKESGETSIYFESINGYSKSNKINFIVLDEEDIEYEKDVDKVTEMESSKYSIKNMNLKDTEFKLQFMNTNTLDKIDEISLENNVVNIDNFLLNGRTYINIYDYCNEIDCTINRKDDTLEISKEINDVIFIVTHEIGTDSFKTIIENGNQKLEYDIGSKYIDTTSCPKDGLECDNDNIYIPIRFLMQAFGYTVSWEQETNSVSINNYLLEKFSNGYKMMITNSLKNIGDKIEENASFVENKQFYTYVTDANNVVQDFQVVFSFSGNVENGATTDGIFEINGNNITLLDSNNISNSELKLLLIQDIEEHDDVSGSGSFPIVIDLPLSEFEVSSKIGESTDGDNSNGYPTIFTVNGKTFKEYKQSIPPWNGVSYWNGTIGYKGCGPVSVSIVCSGYMDETPQTVANYMNNAFGYTGSGSLNGALQHYGFNTELVSYSQGNTEQKEKLQNHLLNGGTAVVSLCSPANGGDCVNSPSSDFAARSHIVAIIGIDPNDLDRVYLSNPNTRKTTGWVSLEYVLKHVRNSGQAYFILASK